MIGVSLFAPPDDRAAASSPSVVPLRARWRSSPAQGWRSSAIGWQTAYHEHVPNEVLSRVTSYDALGSFVAIPIGQLAFGPLGIGVRHRGRP